MRFYLGTPGSQLHAHLAQGCPILVSYAAAIKVGRWLEDSWMHSFTDGLLIDSGAYSVYASGVEVDLPKYVEWAARFPWKDAWAGLDDVSGDWKRSWENYKAGGFPTFHDSDPPELLDDLIPMALEGQGWIGIGLTTPRSGKEEWMRRTLDRIPAGLHVHAWACGLYAHLKRIDSIDSTNWFRDVPKLLGNSLTAHLTPGECLEIIVKRYQRAKRLRHEDSGQLEL